MVYYGYNGQEIEDAEMDNMRRDAREERESHEMYKVYVHSDASENAFLDGIYPWRKASRRQWELLKLYPRVDIIAVR